MAADQEGPTLKDLRAEAVELGFPAEEAEKILAKSPMLAVLEVLRSKQSPTLAETPKEVEKVATLEPKIDPVEEKRIEGRWKTKRQIMENLIMDQLKNGKTGKILIPLSGKEKKGVVNWITNPKNGKQEQVYVTGAVQPVTLNGFQYLVPKGVYVEAPERIVEEVERSFQQTTAAGQEFLVDRIDPETGKSVRDQL